MTARFATTRSLDRGVADATELFATTFGYKPVGVWGAPGRVNLIGEHVDYAGGICLPFALTQLTFAAMAPRDDRVLRLVSMMPGEDSVTHFEIDFDAIGPGNPANWAGYAVGSIWAAVEAGLIAAESSGFDIALISDVPLGAGLSSSAALECAVALGAVELFTGQPADEAVKSALVPCCIRAENEVVGASTGGLDQRISLLGRAGRALEIDYADDHIEHVPADFEGNGLAVLVINTHAPHNLADGQYASRRGIIDAVTAGLGLGSLRESDDAVADAKGWAANNIPDGSTEAEFVELVTKRVRHVATEIPRTARAIEELKRGDFAAFGTSMQASHASLRDDYEVTCPELDCAVEAAMAAGAVGARMTGGGFGGSAIALIHATDVDATAEAIAAAAAAAGLADPEFLVAVPSDGARRLA